jgi:predicted transposase YbfD/YdcC
VEVAYGITSLSPSEADAARLLELVRDHWRIENCLHYVRDVTLGEDACRVRSGSAPQVLAALRNAVVHLLAAVEAESRPAAVERLQGRPAEALQLIGIPPPQ